ncbi:hypothetical protein GQ42DRAFT_165297 [Ramicandelaber brevisporus]|nr:hypothetical protein GQ42DRAFT_165297 [Ramicandelaber brevisporus]
MYSKITLAALAVLPLAVAKVWPGCPGHSPLFQVKCRKQPNPYSPVVQEYLGLLCIDVDCYVKNTSGCWIHATDYKCFYLHTGDNMGYGCPSDLPKCPPVPL